MSSDWYIKINGVDHGPLASERLKQLVQQGKVTADTPVKKGQAGTWYRASHVQGLFAAPAGQSTPATAPPSPKPASSASCPTAEPRSAVPPAQPQSGASASASWYFCEDGKTFGPYSEAELKELALEGTVGPAVQVKAGEGGHWMPARQVPGISFPTGRAREAAASRPVPRTRPETASRSCPFCGEMILAVAKKCKHCGEFLDRGSTTRKLSEIGGSEKRILPLFLLFLFLGYLGAHSFYAGRVGQGLLYLLLVMLIGPLTLALLADPGPNAGAGGMALLGLVGVQFISLLVDLICILIGAYKDGKKQKITRWT